MDSMHDLTWYSRSISNGCCCQLQGIYVTNEECSDRAVYSALRIADHLYAAVDRGIYSVSLFNT
jgi:hypothetical protein